MTVVSHSLGHEKDASHRNGRMMDARFAILWPHAAPPVEDDRFLVQIHGAGSMLSALPDVDEPCLAIVRHAKGIGACTSRKGKFPSGPCRPDVSKGSMSRLAGLRDMDPPSA